MGVLNYQHGDEATKERREQPRPKWLGPSRKEVWKRLAEDMPARYEKRFSKDDKVIIDAARACVGVYQQAKGMVNGKK